MMNTTSLTGLIAHMRPATWGMDGAGANMPSGSSIMVSDYPVSFAPEQVLGIGAVDKAIRGWGIGNRIEEDGIPVIPPSARSAIFVRNGSTTDVFYLAYAPRDALEAIFPVSALEAPVQSNSNNRTMHPLTRALVAKTHYNLGNMIIDAPDIEFLRNPPRPEQFPSQKAVWSLAA